MNTPDSRAATQLTGTLRMTLSMSDQSDITALIGQGLTLCLDILDCDRAMVIARDAAGAPQVLQHCGADPRLFSTTALRLADEKEGTLYISDTIGDSRLAVQESISSMEIRSVLCARLEEAREYFGDRTAYLYCDSRTQRRSFAASDLEAFDLLARLVARLVRRSDLAARQDARIEQLRTQLAQRQFEDLVFASRSFDTCLTLVKQGAVTDVPVLLIGETGTGKESLARIVHKLSRRSDGPFLAVNCGAIPPTLIESELFGHEKGAFTGAISAKKGFFEEASGGTLFLDEIGELPLQAQAHFLRVLQEGEIVRVGATRPLKVDVRIVSATNVDLQAAVNDKLFRNDLFYRLNVLTVNVPAMRERDEDAVLLARFFLNQYSQMYGNQSIRFSREAEKALALHTWPGNVREIQNRIQRAVITASGPLITPRDIGLGEAQDAECGTSLAQAREEVDRRMIAQALAKAPGNLTQAARILDIDRKSLRLLLEKYAIPAS